MTRPFSRQLIALKITKTRINILMMSYPKISEWLIVNKLSLNASKTKFMVFSMPQKKVVIPRLKFADTEIESVDQFNFLGITLDNHLNWNAHIIKLFGQISRNTGILNKIKLFLPRRILKTIYSSLILCQLNYGILVWGQNYKRILSFKNASCKLLRAASIMPILNRCSKN